MHRPDPDVDGHFLDVHFPAGGAKHMGLMRLTHVRPEVGPEATVAEAVQVMAEAEIGAIAIMEGRKIAGLFTERDLMKRVVARRLDPDATPITQVMTRNVVSVLDGTTVARAAALMRANRMRHLVIVDESGDYLGMLAQRHILYDLMNDLSMKVNDLAGYVMADGAGG
jgi:CBS domain-containing protein